MAEEIIKMLKCNCFLFGDQRCTRLDKPTTKIEEEHYEKTPHKVLKYNFDEHFKK